MSVTGPTDPGIGAAETGRQRRIRRSARLTITAVTLAGLAVVGLVLVRGLAADATVALGSAIVGRPAPALAGTGLGGGHVDLAAHRGHLVVVNVWASWCTPCRQELPVLAAARPALARRGVVLLGMVTRDDPAAARALLADTGADFPSVLDPDGTLAVSWGATGVPETFVVDGRGTVIAWHSGPVTAAWLDAHTGRPPGAVPSEQP